MDLEKELQRIRDYFKDTPLDEIKEALIRAGFGNEQVNEQFDESDHEIVFSEEESKPKSFCEYLDFIDNYFDNTSEEIIKTDLIKAGFDEEDFIDESKTITENVIYSTEVMYETKHLIPFCQFALGA